VVSHTDEEWRNLSTADQFAVPRDSATERRSPARCSASTGAAPYRHRNRVERCFDRLKHFRRFVARHEGRTIRFRGFAILAAAMIWKKGMSIRLRTDCAFCDHDGPQSCLGDGRSTAPHRVAHAETALPYPRMLFSVLTGCLHGAAA
jgi:hypothetical protein